MASQPTLTSELNYEAITIARAERAYEAKFFTVVAELAKGKIGIGDLLFLYVAGGGTEEEFSKGYKVGATEGLIKNILRGISEAGFLDEGTKNQMKELMEVLDKQETTNTSTNSGKSNSPSPSK